MSDPHVAAGASPVPTSTSARTSPRTSPRTGVGSAGAVETSRRAQTVRLPDGRRLGYAEFAHPLGHPVLYFHGSPGSRLEGELLEPAARARGLRILALDRPGFGLSDPKPDRTLADWPSDVVALADALGIERFSVLGASGGGPYVAACARSIPDRLRAAGIICGVGPFRTESGATGTARPLFAGSAIGSRLGPALLLGLMGPLLFALRRRPERALGVMARLMPEPDRRALERDDVRRIFVQSLPEALRQGARSAGTEFMLYARPWGFRLEEIPMRVQLWQGELDRSVPPEMARAQARAIPDSRVTFYADEGHLSIGVNRIEEMLDALLA